MGQVQVQLRYHPLQSYPAQLCLQVLTVLGS